MSSAHRVTTRLVSAVVVAATALSTIGLSALPAQASGVVSTCDETSLLSALSGGGSVTFSCSGTINTSARIVLSSNTLIDGAGQDVTIRGGTGDPHQLFFVDTGVTASLSNLTLNGGNADGLGGDSTNGGAILNHGSLTVTRVTFRGNQAVGSGGAIAHSGTTLGVDESSFELNHATGVSGTGGGGAIVGDGGIVTVEESTFLGNSATGGSTPDGGAIRALRTTVSAFENTFVGNYASGMGAAIAVGHTGSLNGVSAAIYGNTFATNASVAGGAIYSGLLAGAVEVYNNVIVHQQGPNCAGALFTNSTTNVEWGGTSSCASVLQMGFTTADPRLGPLKTNGPAGVPMTMAPTLGSSLIDAGTNSVCEAPDANGTASDATCDVGAVQSTGTLTKTYTIDSPGNEADTNTADGSCVSTGAGGVCTLRAAIQQMNFDALATQTSLPFSIPVGLGGPYPLTPPTLAPTTAYPQLNRPASIDGSTQYGYSVAGGPRIRISGTSIPAQTGLNNQASQATTIIRGLAVTDFGSGGIGICACGSAPNTTTIVGNYVGTDGSSDLGNETGIWATSANTVIGGTAATDRNVISGNGNGTANNGRGIRIQASGVTIRGNYIGTDSSGTIDLGTQAFGIDVVSGGSAPVIGGSTAGARNVISGNDSSGISIGAPVSATVQGNYIGTDVTGTAAIPNLSAGILFNGNGAGSLIGGPNPGEGNVIATATNGAVWILAVSNVTVQGNSIGVNAAETALLGSPGGYGVRISGAGNNSSPSSTSNIVADNVIAGAVLANISIESSAAGTPASLNVVRGNYIGTDRTDAIALGNGTVNYTAIRLSGPLTTSNTIGTSGSPNVIANFTGGGSTAGVVVQSGAGAGNIIQYNQIYNDRNGVIVQASTDTVVGPGNTIWNSGNNGIQLVATTNASVIGNTIGVRPNGTAGPNTAFGIQVVSSASADNVGTAIGGTSVGDGNVVGNSGFGGIFLGNPATGITFVVRNALVRGNRVGVTAADVAAPNGGGSGSGIAVGGDGGNHDITIGGTGANEANLVASNYKGITVATAATPNVRIKISGNSVSNSTGGLGIDLDTAGVTANDAPAALDADTGANHLQNFPVLTNAANNGLNTSVDIALDSTASTDFSIELFASPACDASGNGEGSTYLASVPATTNALGHFTTTYVYSGLVPVTHVLTASATVTTAGTSLGDTSEFSACSSVDGVLPNDPDLAVTQSDDGPKTVGQQLTYDIAVYNGGTAPGTDIVLTDTLPTGVTFVSTTVTHESLPGGGTCNAPSAGQFTCNLTDIDPNTTTTVQLVVTPTSAGMKTNLASVTSTGDLISANDSSSHNATANAPADADLDVSQADDGPLYAGQDLTFTVDVYNAGPATATAIDIAGTLSGGATLVSATPETGTCSPAATTYTCSPSNLASGQTETVTVVVTTPPGVATIGNEVDVTSANDPSASNNTDILLESTTLDAAPGFGDPASTDTGIGGAFWAANGNFNAGSDQDVAVTDNQVNGQIAILLGDGAGGFTPGQVIQLSGGNRPSWIVAGLYDAQPGIDLIVNVSNCTGSLDPCGDILFFSGNDDGTFDTGVSIGGPFHAPLGLAEADVDEDGNRDVVAANQAGSDGTIYFGNGSGGFMAVDLGGNGGSYGVAVSDLDGDGANDIVFTGSVSVHIKGSGDRTNFKNPVQYTVPMAGVTAWPVVDDFTGDNYPDVVVPGNVRLMTNDGSGKFGTPGAPTIVDKLPGKATAFLALADFNDDGQKDLLGSLKPNAGCEPQCEDIATIYGAGGGAFNLGEIGHLAHRIPDPKALFTINLVGNARKDVLILDGVRDEVTVLETTPPPPALDNLTITHSPFGPLEAGWGFIDYTDIDFSGGVLASGTLEAAGGPLVEGRIGSTTTKGRIGATTTKPTRIGSTTVKARVGSTTTRPIGSDPRVSGISPANSIDPYSLITMGMLFDPSRSLPDAPLITEITALADGGWGPLLLGSSLAGLPPQEVDWNEVMGDPIAWANVQNERVDTFDFPLLGAVPPAAFFYGRTPLSAIDLDHANTDWTTVLDDMEETCVHPIVTTGPTADDQTLMELAVDRCALDVIPWSEIRFVDVDLDPAKAPIVRFAFSGIDASVSRYLKAGSKTSLAEIALSDLPAPLSNWIDPAVCTALPCVDGSTINTLGDAQAAETASHAVVALNATFGQLLVTGTPATVGGPTTTRANLLGDMTLGDLLLGTLGAHVFPFERILVDDLLRGSSTPTAPAVDYTVSFDVACPTPVDTEISVQLPNGRFRYVGGSAEITGGFVSPHDPGAPTQSRSGLLTWDLPGDAVVCGAATVPADLTLNFSVTPAPDTGSYTSEAIVSDGSTTVRTTDPGDLVLGESKGLVNDEVNEDTPALSPEGLTVGQFPTSSDINYYRVPVTQADEGSLVTVFLMTQNKGEEVVDNDLVLYGTIEDSLVPQASRVGSTTTKPTGDAEGCLPPGFVVELETIEGVPTLADPTTALRSFSTARENQAEYVCTTVGPEDWGRGYLIVQVSHASGPVASAPYVLGVAISENDDTSSCLGPDLDGDGVSLAVDPRFPSTVEAGEPLPAGTDTVFLINEDRFSDLWGEAGLETVLTDLQALSQRGDVDGAIVPVDAAMVAADALYPPNPCAPARLNANVAAITGVLSDMIDGGTPPANVVIVGDDDIVPFARLRDSTTAGNQVAYRSAVQSVSGITPIDNPISKAFRRGFFLSDDPYGTFTPPQDWLGQNVYIPDAAVGRLVESPAEIHTIVQQFIDSNGLLDPKTALSTGEDNATFVAAQIADRMNARATGLNDEEQTNAYSVQTLLEEQSPGDTPYPDDGSWSRADLLCRLNGRGGTSPACESAPEDFLPPGLLSISGHFSHFTTLNADGNGNDQTSATAVGDTAIPDGTIMFTIGCNAGVNVPDRYMSGIAARDWAQMIANKGGILVANQGFGYGATSRLAYSEKLMWLFSHNLDGAFTIGGALADAKQGFWRGRTATTPYDVKAVQEATFYGLPMARITGTATPDTHVAPPLVTDDDTGLPSSIVVYGDPTNTQNPTVFVDPTSDDRVGEHGDYFVFTNEDGDEFSQDIPDQASQPVSEPVYMTQDGLDLTGGLVTKLSIYDIADFNPDVTNLVLDGAFTTNFEPYPASALFPTNYTATSNVVGEDYLTANGAQFIRGPSLTEGTERVFTGMTVRAFYAPDETADPVETDAFAEALQVSDGIVSFSVRSYAGDNHAAYVLYRLDGDTNFRLVRLARSSSTRFSTTVNIGAGETMAQIIGQVVDETGHVTVYEDKTGSAAVSQPTQATFVRSEILPGSETFENGWWTGPVWVRLYTASTIPLTVQVDGGDFETFSPDFFGNEVIVDVPTAGQAEDGVHLVTYYAGNDPTAYVVAVPIDGAPPQVTHMIGQPRYPDLDPTHVDADPATPITVTVTDAGSGVLSCAIAWTRDPASGTVPCGNGTNPVPLPSTEGRYTITVTATDNAQNTNAATPYSFVVVVDDSGLVVTPSTPAGPTYPGTAFTYVTSTTIIRQALHDPQVGPAGFEVAGSGFASCTTTRTYQPNNTSTNRGCTTVVNDYTIPLSASEGDYTFTTTGTDNLGNVGAPDSQTVRLDNTAPEVEWTDPPTSEPVHTSGGTTFVRSDTDLDVTVTDPVTPSGPGSGVDSCTTNLTEDGTDVLEDPEGHRVSALLNASFDPDDECGDTGWDGIETHRIPGNDPDGPYSLTTTAEDNLGNANTTGDTLDVTLDNTAPVFGICPAPINTESARLNANITASATSIVVNEQASPPHTPFVMTITGGSNTEHVLVTKRAKGATTTQFTYTISRSFNLSGDNRSWTTAVASLRWTPVARLDVIGTVVSQTHSPETITLMERFGAPSNGPFLLTVGNEQVQVNTRTLVNAATKTYTYGVTREVNGTIQPAADYAVGTPMLWTGPAIGNPVGTITSTATTFTVNERNTGFPSTALPLDIWVGFEHMTVITRTATASTTDGPWKYDYKVVRGVGGTGGSAHTSDEPVRTGAVQAVYLNSGAHALTIATSDDVWDDAADAPDFALVQGSGVDAGASTLIRTLTAAQTGQVGTYTLPYTVVDNLGSGRQIGCAYEVIYKASGFVAPVQNDTVNSVTAGQGIALKIKLADANNVPITTLTVPDGFAVATASGPKSGTCNTVPDFGVQVERYKGGSSFQNLGGGSYQFNWAADKALQGSCRTLAFRLPTPAYDPASPPAGPNGFLASRRYQFANFDFKAK